MHITVRGLGTAEKFILSSKVSHENALKSKLEICLKITIL